MLTNAAAKAATPGPRAYKLADAGGLHLFIAPTGSKSWRLKYRWPKGPSSREKLLTIGRFPEVPVALARILQAEAKERLAAGVDPASLRRARDERGESFEHLARAWHAHNLANWSDAHAADVLASLERDLFARLGKMVAGEIGPTDLLAVLHKVEARGCVETARRLRQRLSAIFGFGIAQGLVERDPAAQLGRAMRHAPPSRPQPALTTIEECRALLAACETIPVASPIRLASRFLALTAVRLDAVRGMRWDELEDLDGPAPAWRVPPARMKLKRARKHLASSAHLVPLSPQAVAVLREAMFIFAPSFEAAKMNMLVFPGRDPTRPIGEGALRDLYARSGFTGRHVPHGWRSSFSTILRETLGDAAAGDVERALAHSPKDKVEAAYNRAAQLDRRRALFERWGEMLAG